MEEAIWTEFDNLALFNKMLEEFLFRQFKLLSCYNAVMRKGAAVIYNGKV